MKNVQRLTCLVLLVLVSGLFGLACSKKGSSNNTSSGGGTTPPPAAPPPTTTSSFTVTVEKLGDGTGSITSTPVGINCGTDCTEIYASGTSLTLVASPESGATFSGWTGACSGTANCVLSING